jgi:hypothetical protein
MVIKPFFLSTFLFACAQTNKQMFVPFKCRSHDHSVGKSRRFFISFFCSQDITVYRCVVVNFEKTIKYHTHTLSLSQTPSGEKKIPSIFKITNIVDVAIVFCPCQLHDNALYLCGRPQHHPVPDWWCDDDHHHHHHSELYGQPDVCSVHRPRPSPSPSAPHQRRNGSDHWRLQGVPATRRSA